MKWTDITALHNNKSRRWPKNNKKG